VSSLAEVRETIVEKRKFLHEVHQQAGGELDMSRITLLNGDSAYKAAEIKRLHEELSGLQQEHDQLALIEEQLKGNDVRYDGLTQPVTPMVFPNGNGQHPALGRYEPKKTLLDTLREHKGFQAFVAAGSHGTMRIELPHADFKTLITLASEIYPAADRTATVPLAREERTVSDLMNQGQTNSNSIEYFEQTTFTNAAAEVAESAQGSPVSKPEATLDWTLRTDPVQTIAVWIPVTRQALDDVPQLEATIRGELAFMVRRREETQILSGDGTSPNISGILDRSNVQTTAVGVGGAIDAVYTAMQLVRGSAGAGFAEPTAVVAHPNDWTAIKLSRTTDGIYLWGNPSDEGPDRIWGKEVRQTTGMTENTILVGAFRPYATILRRQGVSVVLSTEHASFFIQNQVAVLAEERLALQVTRPSAFCTVTGA